MFGKNIFSPMKTLIASALLVSSFALATGGSASAAGLTKGTESPDHHGNVGALYTLTNAAAGNSVVAYNRASDGTLTLAGTYPTGGLGTGAALGSQGALVLSEDGRWLFAVDAGSNEISVLSVDRNGLSLADKVSSGGTMPISLTANGDLLYVLSAGGNGNITGFNIPAQRPTFRHRRLNAPLERQRHRPRAGAVQQRRQTTRRYREEHQHDRHLCCQPGRQAGRSCVSPIGRHDTLRFRVRGSWQADRFRSVGRRSQRQRGFLIHRGQGWQFPGG